jgi:hypothetical protein
MTSTQFARISLAATCAVSVALAPGCRLEEGVGSVARIEVVIRNPPPDMLIDSIPDACFAGLDPAFVLIKRLSGAGTSQVTDVNALALHSGDFDAQANTCTLLAFAAGRPGFHRAVATDAGDWVADCGEPFEFFFAAVPARHVLRFTVGAEDCERTFMQVTG